MRDDFAEPIKRALADRVGKICSRPDCGALTSGPQDDPSKAVNIGVAAHITAASPGGPRYDEILTSEERCSAENGIWLCQNCGKLVDDDPKQFPASTLRAWKAKAESAAKGLVGRTVGKAEPKIPPLSEKLRAPRPEPDPESIALKLLMKHSQAYMRVVRLIDDIGKLPHNSIVNIARPPSYDDAKRALSVKFSEDYSATQQDLETAMNLLEAVRDSGSSPTDRAAVDEILSAIREVATTVDGMIAWAKDKHNEPISLGMLHQRPKASDEAREAARHMAKLAAQRMIARGQN